MSLGHNFFTHDEQLVRDAIIAYSRSQAMSALPAEPLSKLFQISLDETERLYDRPSDVPLAHRRRLAIALQNRGAAEVNEQHETLGMELLASVTRIRATFSAWRQDRIRTSLLEIYVTTLPSQCRADPQLGKSTAQFYNMCRPLIWGASLDYLHRIDWERPVPTVPDVPDTALDLFEQMKRLLQREEYPGIGDFTAYE